MDKRKILNIIVIATLVFSLILGVPRMFRKAIRVGDSLYYKVNDSLYKRDKSHYIVRHEEDTFTIFYGDNEATATVEMMMSEAFVQITYSDGHTEHEFILRDLAKFRDELPPPGIDKKIWANMTEPHNEMARGIYKIYAGMIDTFPTSWWLAIFFGGTVIYILGAVYLFYPDEIVALQNEFNIRAIFMFDVYDFELSDFGRKALQVAGAIGMILGIGLIIFPYNLFVGR